MLFLLHPRARERKEYRGLLPGATRALRVLAAHGKSCAHGEQRETKFGRAVNQKDMIFSCEAGRKTSIRPEEAAKSALTQRRSAPRVHVRP